LGDFRGSIRAAVVNDDDLDVVGIAVRKVLGGRTQRV
jgi:hypothetical protein